ncbi:serotransferrin-like isoform X1 [Sminthopsis crassicaudata]|uniref:serotransferrin-like isoform X1 n=1 Tax=Sminthopsis crassicaudata TaxID=9301 RepID=UPI003D68512D
MDYELYLGYKFIQAIKPMKGHDLDKIHPSGDKKVTWCTVNDDEKIKCDEWSVFSRGVIECAVGENSEDCIVKIMKGEADAMSTDGGYVYIAGKCGLVPVLAESYTPKDGQSHGKDCVNKPAQGESELVNPAMEGLARWHRIDHWVHLPEFKSSQTT